jgi:hypothetical protein
MFPYKNKLIKPAQAEQMAPDKQRENRCDINAGCFPFSSKKVESLDLRGGGLLSPGERERRAEQILRAPELWRR